MFKNILAALGFYHMQSAYDRNNYVTIQWDNITPGLEENFEKYTSSEVTHYNQTYGKLSDAAFAFTHTIRSFLWDEMKFEFNSFSLSIPISDYLSVLHYGAYGFSKNGKPTIVPVVSALVHFNICFLISNFKFILFKGWKIFGCHWTTHPVERERYN